MVGYFVFIRVIHVISSHNFSNRIEYWSFGRPALNGKERIEVWKQCLKSNALSSDSHIRGYVKPSVNYSSNPEYLSFHEVKALYDR